MIFYAVYSYEETVSVLYYPKYISKELAFMLLGNCLSSAFGGEHYVM